MMEKFITKPWVKAVLEDFKTQEVDTLKTRIDVLSEVLSDWNETDSTSNAYIKNKPTIPSAVTESTVSGWGFTKNTGNVSSTAVSTIVTITQSAYDDLATKDANTLYLITES